MSIDLHLLMCQYIAVFFVFKWAIYIAYDIGEAVHDLNQDIYYMHHV